MRKICVLLSLLLCLTACQKNSSTLTLDRAESLALSQTDGFIRADDDFISTNFGTPTYLQNAAVFLSENSDGTEFGFFELNDVRHREEMIAAIRDYLASEEQSVRSLAALYPADDLQARLHRFEKATVGVEGHVVYYFLTDGALAQQVIRNLKE